MSSSWADGCLSIPGTRKLERLDENTRGIAVELRPNDLRDIESAALKIAVHGRNTPKVSSG
jgi:hypothetical protein